MRQYLRGDDRGLALGMQAQFNLHLRSGEMYNARFNDDRFRPAERGGERRADNP